ncbi:MAG TPA: WD40 repeat domain-containing protein, partial [Kofleriaceae bacterium]|nr:WD40 repeat domain-containing protein [Kofleriaceae bacterium]
RVEIIHEALLAAWPRVQGWIHEDAASARMRDQLRVAARQWDERERARGLLWRDEALAELEWWRSHHEGHGLTATERAFADASRAAAVRGRRRRRVALITAFAVLGIALAIMYWLRGEAAEQRSLVAEQAEKLHAQLVQNLRERGQQALFGGYVEEAQKYLGKAQALGDRSPALHFMLARAHASEHAELATIKTRADQIWFAAWSPDGARVLTEGSDSAVQIWDAATGRERFALGDHAPPVVAAWSPAGEIATADAAGVIRLWTADGQLRAAIRGAQRTPIRIAFSADGARFAVTRVGGNVALVDTAAGTLHATWQADPARAEAIAFDPAGARIVTAGRSGQAVVWSLEGKELARLVGHTDAIWHAVFDATGERVITASLDKTARVWDAQSGKPLHRLVGHDGRVTGLAVDVRARRIATASADTTVRLWSLDTGELLVTLRGHTAQVTAVAFAPGDQLVSASADGTARVWDLVHGVEAATYLHGGFLSAVDLDPTGQRLVTAGWAGTAKIWDLRRQSRLATYASPVAGAWADGVTSIYSAMVEGGRLAHIGPRGIAVWDLASEARWTWTAPALVGGALTPDGTVGVAADEQGVISVLDGRGALQRQFRGPPQGVTCVAIFPDGRRAVTGSPGGRLAIWELATGRLIAERQVGPVSELGVSRDGGALVAFENASAQLQRKASAWLLPSDLSSAVQLADDAGLLDAKFSPDGARLVTLSIDSTARVWRRDGRLEATLPHAAPVAMVAWSAKGSWLATGTRAGALTIWDRATWQARKVIAAHVNYINALAIDERDSLIASVAGDGVVKLWDVATYQEVARIPTGMGAAHLAFEPGQLLVTGTRATQSWRCDR